MIPPTIKSARAILSRIIIDLFQSSAILGMVNYNISKRDLIILGFNRECSALRFNDQLRGGRVGKMIIAVGTRFTVK